MFKFCYAEVMQLRMRLVEILNDRDVKVLYSIYNRIVYNFKFI